MSIIDIFKKKSKNVCPKCKSHHLVEVATWYDKKNDCTTHDIVCNNCGYRYTIKD